MNWFATPTCKACNRTDPEHLLQNELAISSLSAMTEQQQPADDAAQQHDFEVQKQVHQQIRNDPDYDDWEYGTEPLPREAWTAKVSKG